MLINVYRPERVAHHEESYVLIFRVAQNLLTVRFDHFTVRDGDGSSIVAFL